MLVKGSDGVTPTAKSPGLQLCWALTSSFPTLESSLEQSLSQHTITQCGLWLRTAWGHISSGHTCMPCPLGRGCGTHRAQKPEHGIVPPSWAEIAELSFAP